MALLGGQLLNSGLKFATLKCPTEKEQVLALFELRGNCFLNILPRKAGDTVGELLFGILFSLRRNVSSVTNFENVLLLHRPRSVRIPQKIGEENFEFLQSLLAVRIFF